MNGSNYEVAIVGAGVVGLAVAARCAVRWPGRVLVLERHDGIVREASSRNSEVVHAGLYYPAGSLKARTCVRGRELLYRRCDRLSLPVRRCGKVLVSPNEAGMRGLEELLRRGTANGVDDLALIDSQRLHELEPATTGHAALWSPSTGIVDSHALAASLEAEASRSADLLFGATVLEASRAGDWRLIVEQAGERTAVTLGRVVNAAGLDADRLAEAAGIDVDAAGLRHHPFVGSWFAVAPRHRGRVQRLVYPVGRAEAPGLGIHGCLDLAGGLRLGPDAQTGREAQPDASRFLAAGQRLFPWLEPGDLAFDQSGVRAKLTPDGSFRDFVVREEPGHPGWITLAGIESPGLTAALALAEEVEALL